MSDLASFRPSAGVLPTRDAVPARYRWDLSSICQDWAAPFLRRSITAAASSPAVVAK